MANIIHFEDDDSTIRAVQDFYLDSEKHSIVEVVKTNRGIFSVFRKLLAKEIEADLFILDGKLINDDEVETFEFESKDGKTLSVNNADMDNQGQSAQMVQYINTESGLYIPTIGASNLPMKFQNVEVTVDLTKTGFSQINETIEEILG